jgi:hypothetical protein
MPNPIAISDSAQSVKFGLNLKTILIVWVLKLFFILNASAQTTIKGKVIDAKKQTVVGANISLKGTYDGASTDSAGVFKFTTLEKDSLMLEVSCIGFVPVEQKISLQNTEIEVNVTLNEAISTLKEVVISAGAFEASDEKKMVMLKPLDIVTTAGAAADIFGAIQTLPGASRVGESEGLFVRGGSASETKAIIDGMIVQNPFFSSVPNVAQRGRFSPFLFKGTSFSTGGYSAQYGQGLSSVLVLNTNDLPSKTDMNVGMNFAGISLSGTVRKGNTSIASEGSYNNLAPAFFINKQTIDWEKAPEAINGSITLRHKPNANGIIKAYANFSNSFLRIRFSDPTEAGGASNFRLAGKNIYSNATYQQSIGKWTWYSGLSYSWNKDQIRFNQLNIQREDERLQGRMTIAKDLTTNISLLIGSELHNYTYRNFFESSPNNQFINQFSDTYWASFAESDIYITPKLVGRVGVRSEYSSVINRWNVAPRLSVAYKTGVYSQISLAYGQFFQNPITNYLYTNKNLDFEKAGHFIANYQIIKQNRTFRIELYQKDYDNLVREKVAFFDPDLYRFPTGNTDNSGFGYARGLDVFYRDQKTIKNADFWISYSFLDTKRLFQNYKIAVMPTFASKHNLTIVYKQDIWKNKFNAGFTYNFASGRPYFNPNNDLFMNDLTPNFHNFGFNGAYLTSLKGNLTVLYFAVDNVFNIQNVFGYRYSTNGTQRIAINPPALRTFFAGINISISKK